MSLLKDETFFNQSVTAILRAKVPESHFKPTKFYRERKNYCCFLEQEKKTTHLLFRKKDALLSIFLGMRPIDTIQEYIVMVHCSRPCGWCFEYNLHNISWDCDIKLTGDAPSIPISPLWFKLILTLYHTKICFIRY